MALPRRVFLMSLAASGAALGTTARAQVMVDPKDAQAAALGYVADATSVDTKKYPRYAAGQVCSNCALYTGKPDDKSGPCSIFPGKQVAGPGWCSAWVKKG